MRTKAIILCCVFGITCPGIYSQYITRSVISPISCSMEKEGYYLSNTLGEAVTASFFANFHFVSQGFQQPSLINNLPPGTIEPLDAIDVFPNPVSNLLTISFRVVSLKTYFVKVIDLRGREIQTIKLENMSSRDEKLDFSHYLQGLYFIHVYSDNLKMNRVFKIEKL